MRRASTLFGGEAQLRAIKHQTDARKIQGQKALATDSLLA
jgi:hypothetical protein